MKLELKNIKQDNIIFFDIEYDRNSLIQLASLILSRCESNIFELRRSFNVYVKPNHSLSRFFTGYTNITDAFLCDNGVDLAVTRTLVNEVVLDFIPEETLWVSHGVKNDLGVLADNGLVIEAPHTYCTYNKAKELMNRSDHLSLRNVAAEDGFCMFDDHNAYADVWGTLHAFCYLNKLENKEYYMRLYNANEVNIVSVPKKKIVERRVELKIDDVLAMPFTEYTAALEAQLKKGLRDLKENTVFKIDFKTNDELEFADVEHFYLLAMATLVKILVKGEIRDRERRLAVYNKDLYINYNNLMDLVNKETIINCFNVEFSYDNMRLFFVN